MMSISLVMALGIDMQGAGQKKILSSPISSSDWHLGDI